MRDLVAERAPDLLERCVALVGEDPFPRASDSTRFAQPAIFCASLAGWDALDLDAVAGAGHSLGELAALAGAGGGGPGGPPPASSSATTPCAWSCCAAS